MIQVIAVLIFLGALALLFGEKVDRTIVAIGGAALMVTAGVVLGFYHEPEAISAIDFETLGLLLGMMILVALLEPTGLFEYLAVLAGRLSRGNPARLMLLLGAVAALLSTFLNNVTTVVLVAPVTILISEILGVSPVPFLMAETMLSNIGGVATLIGDPPNIVIASASGLTFEDFLTHAAPVTAVAVVVTLVLLRWLFRAELAIRPADPDAVQRLNLRDTLNDTRTMFRVLVVLGVAIVGFFLQSWLGVTPSFIALTASAAALVWVRPDMRELMPRIEWTVLLFFTGLFVLVGGLEVSGVLGRLAELIARLEGSQPLLLGIVIIWVIAILSAVVDNVPVTIAMIPVLEGVAAAGLDVTPLWWALAFGAGFGGNATIIGSTTNIVVVHLSEQTHTPITPAMWLRRGLPVMAASCAVASVLYALFFPLFGG